MHNRYGCIIDWPRVHAGPSAKIHSAKRNFGAAGGIGSRREGSGNKIIGRLFL